MKIVILLFLSFCLLQCSENSNDPKPLKDLDPPPNKENCATPKEPSQISGTSCHMVFSLANNACASVRWLIGPGTDTESAFLLSFENDGNPQMPSLRVGAVAVLLEDANGVQNKRFDLTVTPKVNNPGQFTVNNIRFTQGVWQIRAQLFDGYDLVEEHDGPHGLFIFE